MESSHRPEAPVRKHRQVIYLNDSELAAIRLYSEKFKVRSRSALIRESVMLRVLSVLDENQPTLFLNPPPVPLSWGKWCYTERHPTIPRFVALRTALMRPVVPMINYTFDKSGSKKQ